MRRVSRQEETIGQGCFLLETLHGRGRGGVTLCHRRCTEELVGRWKFYLDTLGTVDVWTRSQQSATVRRLDTVTTKRVVRCLDTVVVWGKHSNIKLRLLVPQQDKLACELLQVLRCTARRVPSSPLKAPGRRGLSTTSARPRSFSRLRVFNRFLI